MFVNSKSHIAMHSYASANHTTRYVYSYIYYCILFVVILSSVVSLRYGIELSYIELSESRCGTYGRSWSIGYGCLMVADESSITSTPIQNFKNGWRWSYFQTSRLAFRSWLPIVENIANGKVLKIVIPLWILIVLISLPGLKRLIKQLRRRRIAADYNCMKCEYNLEGNLSGKCPECGTPTEM